MTLKLIIWELPYGEGQHPVSRCIPECDISRPDPDSKTKALKTEPTLEPKPHKTEEELKPKLSNINNLLKQAKKSRFSRGL